MRRRSLVLVGQCAFTFHVLSGLLSQEARVSRLVLLRAPDEDPFPDLTIVPTPWWLVQHRFYYSGWRRATVSLCSRHGIDLVETSNPIHAICPADALIVAGLARRVPASVLGVFGAYALNVHPSLLPRFGGPQPEAQTLLAGQQESGVSIHTMTEDFDSGPIRWQGRFAVEGRDDVFELERKAGAMAGRAAAELMLGELPAPLPASGPSSYFSWYGEQVLDLNTCRDMTEVEVRMRLRPEGWAFFDLREDRIYPVVLAEKPDRTGRLFKIGHLEVPLRSWIRKRNGTIGYETVAGYRGVRGTRVLAVGEG